ncbi:FAD-binding oxidoreductase, partial [Microbacterium sp.]|uniref:FAD-binding oxidoreductase n=1 Tax=Microbacterium sp. TaxID=51671 RepID=UPI003C78C41E
MIDAVLETGTIDEPTARALAELRELLPGRVHSAADAEERGLVRCFNTALQHTAPIVVAATGPADVVHVVQTARRHGIPVTAIGSGHGLLHSIDRGVIVLTRGIASVHLDPERRLVRVGAGTVWSEVLDAAAPHGLAPLAGSAPHVGVIGYLLGGGLGPVARTFGYAADYVRELEVITGVGEHLVVSADSHADLFWALRGGKRGLGIVVAVTIELLPLAELYGGGLYYTGDAVASALHAWGRWTETLPTEMSTSAAIVRLPPLPELPDPIRGQTVLHVRTAYVGTAEQAEGVLAPLRAAAAPVLDSIGHLPYSALGSIHQDPANPMPVVEGG